MFKKAFGSLLKCLGFITIFIAVGTAIITAGYTLFLSLIIVCIGLIIYIIDSLTVLTSEKIYKFLQITLSIIYIVFVVVYFNKILLVLV